MLLTALSTIVDARRPDFPCTEVTEHSVVGPDGTVVAEFLATLARLRAQLLERAGDRMTFQLWDLLEHVRHTRRIHRFEVPIVDAPLGTWARRNNAILITADGRPLDGRGEALLPRGEEPPAGTVPVPTDAAERSRRVRTSLVAHGVPVPPHLPPVRGAAECLPRPAGDICERALALGLTSVFAQSLLKGDPEDPDAMRRGFPRAFAARTAVERSVFTTRNPHDAGALAWRVEAAKTMLWLLGGPAELGPAVTSADVDQIYGALFALPEEQFIQGGALRPLGEILDAWELTHSLRHAALRAQRHGAVVPAANLDVLAERSMAFGWALDRVQLDYEVAARAL